MSNPPHRAPTLPSPPIPPSPTPNLDAAFPSCCTDPNILTHQTDTHPFHLGYRKTNGLEPQPTFPCPIFLVSLPSLPLTPWENATVKGAEMNNWMETIIFQLLMAELGETVSTYVYTQCIVCGGNASGPAPLPPHCGLQNMHL